MQLSTLPQSYDSTARLLHWASAVLIVAAFIMGLAHDAPPREARAAWLNVHAIVGIVVLLLAIIRLGWRAGHAVPPPPAGSSALAARAIKIGHGALYLMMVAVPLMGFAPLFTRGRGVNFGLFQIASPIERTKQWIGPATEAHEIAAFALIALAVGHIAAAIYHQVALKDGVLLRMMPDRR